MCGMQGWWMEGGWKAEIRGVDPVSSRVFGWESLDAANDVRLSDVALVPTVCP